MPNAEPAILPATAADLPAIARLAAVIWRACYPGIISPAQIDYMLARMYAPETMREELDRGGIHYAQLQVDGELAGFAAFGPVDPPAYKLHKLYLHPDRQGRGLGRRLLQHCQAAARELGARRLILNVNKQNAKAIAFYRRNGFTISDEVVVDIGAGFVMDDYVMTRELEAGESAGGKSI